MELSVFHFVALGAVAVLGALLLLALFEPGLPYDIRAELPPCGTHESLGLVAALVDVAVLGRSQIEALTNGAEFYEAELLAIRGARRSVHIEAYIFHPSRIADRFLESKGEIIAESGDFPYCRAEDSEPAAGDMRGLAVTSAPSAGKATRARILFQVLLASARESVMINCPYFLPDRNVIRELGRAVHRGASVEVIVPGRRNNHPIARRASRRRYGDLLRAGARLFEYRPAMMHAKILIVDQVWSVVGSTNFDNRSFGLNDEVNLAVQDRALAQRLERDFRADLARSREVTSEEWQRRRLGERVLAGIGAVLERHQ